jgi:ABC-2 type transport system ATP-binding protein
MISIQNLSKKYPKSGQPALDTISLDIASGELFGLIGPDGAGKTTLFRILTTLLLPDSGLATVMGYDVVRDYREIRRRVGYMPGRFSLYQDLSVRENLEFYATVFGTTIAANYDRIKPIYSQIEPFEDRLAGRLSGGMKQKLALSCALVHEPEVLLLDEPTTGVDPVSRQEFWDMLDLLRQQGLTIVVSTPYMDEASRCSRIALINGGRILRTDTPDAIIRSQSKPFYAVRGTDMYGLLKATRAWSGTYTCFAFGESHHVQLHDDADASALVGYLRSAGFLDVEMRVISPDIEDVFMELLVGS